MLLWNFDNSISQIIARNVSVKLNEEKYVVTVDEDDKNLEYFFSFCGNKKIQNSYN